MKTELFIALDGMSIAQAIETVRVTAPQVDGLKLNDLWDVQHEHPNICMLLNEVAGLSAEPDAHQFWVDTKVHDTPQTVRNRVRRACDGGAELITVHAQGGRAMMEAAVEEAVGCADIIAVTLLTSVRDEDLPPGVNRQEEVLRLAKMAYSAGVGSFVCATGDLEMVMTDSDLRSMRRVVPGIRLAEDKGARGQVHMGSPDVAVANGAEVLVLGSTVTKAEDPVKALEEVRRLVEQAESAREEVAS